MEYTLTDARLRSLKAAVTKANNKKQWMAVIRACDKALRIFAAEGYPDCWSDFERHKLDAQLQLRLGVQLGNFLR